MRFAAIAVAALLGSVPAAAQDKQDYAQIERGRYLTYAGDCAACHTIPGQALFAGGRPLETPFGTLVPPNITRDVDTGIGAWTGDEFYRALHEGVSRSGHNLYPAFPYPAYTKVRRADADAIRTYLSTIQPVRNQVKVNQLPFPFDLRASLAGWKALYFTPGEYRENPGKTSEWNRGAYLVQGLGHCGTCHTPKNLAGADETTHFLQGASLQGWFAPNITGDSYNGMGRWSADDIVQYLRDGSNALDKASGPMAEVITLSTSHLTEADLRAIAAYLLDQPGPRREALPTPLADTDAQMRIGSALYVDQCAACHSRDGKGVANMFPRLAGAPKVLADQPDSMLRAVLEGAQSVATPRAPTGPAMPSFGWKFNDTEVAAVLTYIRNAWGNAAPAVSADAVKQGRAAN